MVKERNFKVSIDEAKEWYLGDNEELKKLALNIFSSKELCDDILEDIQYSIPMDNVCISVPTEYKEKLQAIAKLMMVAAELNSRNTCPTGLIYTITKDTEIGEVHTNFNDRLKTAGTVDFKGIYEAETAIKVLEPYLDVLFQ